MTNYITNQHDLENYGKSLATDALAEAMSQNPDISAEDCRDLAGDFLREMVDGSEHVIYHWKAHSICTTCDVASAEEEFWSCGTVVESYDAIASGIVYFALCQIGEEALETLVAEAFEAEAA